MQKFALLHNGTDQGWQTTYLAFHIADRLGAPLQVLILDSGSDKAALAQRAAQVEIGGRAAGVTIETHLVRDFSADTLKENIKAIDGLFLPRRLIANKEAVSLFLEAFSCPLWILSLDDEKSNAMAVLVDNPLLNTQLITYANTLSQRLQRSLTALVLDEQFESTLNPELMGIKWMSLTTFAASQISQALNRLQAGLLFISEVNISITEELTGNYVIYPDNKDA
jgi:hypothetical protein